MKIANLYLLAILAASLLAFTACEKSSGVEQLQEPEQEIQIREGGPSLQTIAQVMAENNLGKGAMFIEPNFPGASFGVLKDIVFDPLIGFVSGEAAFFEGSYGQGDFWRQNPDGTVSVKLTTNEASASHIDFATAEEHTGTGHLNIKYTGNLVVVDVPFPPFQFTFLEIDPNENAQTIHGQAKVQLGGDPNAPERKLKFWFSANPGDQDKVDFVLED